MKVNLPVLSSAVEFVELAVDIPEEGAFAARNNEKHKNEWDRISVKTRMLETSGFYLVAKFVILIHKNIQEPV